MMIKNIIFDLGGVLVDIDVDKTWSALAALGLSVQPGEFDSFETGSLIDDFERGLVSTDHFLQALQRRCNQGVTIDDLQQAACALLLDFPRYRVELLTELSSSYRLFLLSNTNEMHITVVNQRLKERQSVHGLQDLFIQPYLSYEMGLRKPESAIFQQVIDEQQLAPAETLFIDDTVANTQAAAQCGLKVWHKPPSIEICDALSSQLACLV